VEYSFDRPIDPVQLQRLLQTTGWAADRTVEEIERLLSGSPLVIGAWDGDRLVGFARALTDGVFRALIDDVVVHPACRRSGIGTELMRRLLERLNGVEEVFLRCGAEVVPFYERLGFARASCITMDHVSNDEENGHP